MSNFNFGLESLDMPKFCRESLDMSLGPRPGHQLQAVKNIKLETLHQKPKSPGNNFVLSTCENKTCDFAMCFHTCCLTPVILRFVSCTFTCLKFYL